MSDKCLYCGYFEDNASIQTNCAASWGASRSGASRSQTRCLWVAPFLMSLLLIYNNSNNPSFLTIAGRPSHGGMRLCLSVYFFNWSLVFGFVFQKLVLWLIGEVNSDLCKKLIVLVWHIRWPLSYALSHFTTVGLLCFHRKSLYTLIDYSFSSNIILLYFYLSLFSVMFKAMVAMGALADHMDMGVTVVSKTKFLFFKFHI